MRGMGRGKFREACRELVESINEHEAERNVYLDEEPFVSANNTSVDASRNMRYWGTNPLCLRYQVIYSMAVSHDLQDLIVSVVEIVAAIDSGKIKGLRALHGSLRKGGRAQLDSSNSQTPRREIMAFLDERCSMMEKMSQVFLDLDVARNWARSDVSAKYMMEVFGGKNKFDLGHEMHAVQESLYETMQAKHKNERIQEFSAFLAEQRIDQDFRNEEGGYRTAKAAADLLTDAELANDAGKKAWKARKKWAAELYWVRATELGSEAKFWSNLALARIHLGRLLRSSQLGFREMSITILESAISCAKAAVELDPMFARGHQRWVEALLALAPHERSMEAYRVARNARNVLESPPAVLLELEELSKTRARQWLPIASAISIPSMLGAALANLRSTVVSSMSVDICGDEELQAAGEKICDAVFAVRGVLQLLYIRRSQWERERKSTTLAPDDNQIQSVVEAEIQLRAAAKLVPLRIVEICDVLKCIVFLEEPWGLWGLDKLDRKGVERLPFNATDPCEKDNNAGDCIQLREMQQRATGGLAMDSDAVEQVRAIMGGRGPLSYSTDMSPNTSAAFCLGVMQRILLSKKSSLTQAASERIIFLYRSPNAVWAGGEFLGLCVNCAVGLGKYGLPRDPERTAKFMRTPGGVATMATEILQSRDDYGYFQKSLCDFPAEDWANLAPMDISPVVQFVTQGLDESTLVPTDNIAPYAPLILSKVFAAVPDIIHLLRTGDVDDIFDPAQFLNSYHIMEVLESTTFGVFLTRRFEFYEQYLIEKGTTDPTVREVLSLLVAKWRKLSKDKRSSYRWETLDAETKARLSHMAPVDKVDILTKGADVSNTGGDGPPRRPIPKAPECAFCGRKEGFGVPLCKCKCRGVLYCNNGQCQPQDWPNHKAACKQIRANMPTKRS